MNSQVHCTRPSRTTNTQAPAMVSLAVKAHEIQVDAGGEHDLLAVVQPVDDGEAALDAARPLKVQISSRGGHIAF